MNKVFCEPMLIVCGTKYGLDDLARNVCAHNAVDGDLEFGERLLLVLDTHIKYPTSRAFKIERSIFVGFIFEQTRHSVSTYLIRFYDMCRYIV